LTQAFVGNSQVDRLDAKGEIQVENPTGIKVPMLGTVVDQLGVVLKSLQWRWSETASFII